MAPPPSPPPPARPPPSPPPLVLAQIGFSLTVDADVSSFDAEGFKSGLASKLPDVETSDIALTIAAGSVAVDVLITTPEEAGDATHSAVAALTPAELSSATGVTVQSVSAPTIQLVVAVPPPTVPPPLPPPSPPPVATSPSVDPPPPPPSATPAATPSLQAPAPPVSGAPPLSGVGASQLTQGAGGSDGESMTGGAVAGIVVGALLVACLCALALVKQLGRHRKRRADASAATDAVTWHADSTAGVDVDVESHAVEADAASSDDESSERATAHAVASVIDQLSVQRVDQLRTPDYATPEGTPADAEAFPAAEPDVEQRAVEASALHEALSGLSAEGAPATPPGSPPADEYGLRSTGPFAAETVARDGTVSPGNPRTLLRMRTSPAMAVGTEEGGGSGAPRAGGGGEAGTSASSPGANPRPQGGSPSEEGVSFRL